MIAEKQNILLKKTLQKIIKSGDWLVELERKQDDSYPSMKSTYARVCYQDAKKVMKEIKT